MTPRRSATLAIVLVLLAVVAAFVATSKTHSSADVDRLLGTAGQVGAADVLPASQGRPLPSLAPATAWDNSPPLTDASLRGKVVLVDFWDASCVNCRRTFGFLRSLQATYAAQGLVILGVHSPEFAFERSHAYVAQQTRELDVTWPVAEDPDMAIWDEFGNEYWPATYLADRDGIVRYAHVGEGDDAQIEGAVRTLLADGGSAGGSVAPTVSSAQQPPTADEDVTPETYLGSAHGALPGVVSLSPGVSRLTDHVVLARGQALTLRFRAKDVYLVLAPGTPPSALSVELDGRPIAVSRGPDVSAGGTLTVTHEDLYHLVSASSVVTGTLAVAPTAGSVQAYSFTFGG